jgi:hypothetical protein
VNIRTFIGIGSLTLMATLGAAGAQADVTPVQDAGVWRVYALKDDNGKFLACKASMHQNDQGLEIAAGPNDSFYLWLTDASWHFGTDPIPVQLHADGRALGTWKIVPFKPQIVVVDLAGNSGAQTALRASNRTLIAHVGNQQMTLSLQDAGAAISALTNCVSSGGASQIAKVAPAADVQVQSPVASSAVPVFLQCSLESKDKYEYIIKTEEAINKAMRAVTLAGWDGAKYYADQVAIRDSKVPQIFPPIPLVLALDESQNRISNRQAVSWGPAFTQTDVHWRETDTSGLMDYQIDRVTGAIIVKPVLRNGSLGYWLLRGTCAVTTQRAF